MHIALIRREQVRQAC